MQMQTLRIQASPIVPSVPAPCCSSSSSSSSPTPSPSSSCSSRHAGNLRLHWRAADSRSGPAAAAVSLRIDLLADAPRRGWRQCSRWCSGAANLSCCKACLGGGGSNEQLPDWRQANNDDGFLQASLLVSETIRHYNLRKQGFFEEAKWHSSSQILPLSLHANVSKSDVKSIGHGFLRRFQNPTIFLKIACDGDLLLPIIVGEFAVERLIDTLRDDKDEGSQNEFKFIGNLVGTLGYEVKNVRITKRVVNTYYARIFLGKPAERATLSVDSRPSDAINVAIRCQAPIYVSKDIVWKDAIKIVYGTWRGNSVKTVYDVSLDSASEGPDLLAEELDLIIKMNSAVVEERYKDAAMWRDRLSKLRARHQKGTPSEEAIRVKQKLPNDHLYSFHTGATGFL